VGRTYGEEKRRGGGNKTKWKKRGLFKTAVGKILGRDEDKNHCISVVGTELGKKG